MRHLPDTLSATSPAIAPVNTTATAPVIDPADYRKALSCFGTGVTVVTAHHEGQDWGMTCNSFTSVSLNPRLVLWCIRKEASSLAAFTQSGGFSVSVLTEEQAATARQFAKGTMAERFAGESVVRQSTKRLRLSQCVAWFDCTVSQQVDAGDHYVMIGHVHDFGWNDAHPLAFSRSHFAQFKPLPE